MNSSSFNTGQSCHSFEIAFNLIALMPGGAPQVGGCGTPCVWQGPLHDQCGFKQSSGIFIRCVGLRVSLSDSRIT